MTKRRAVISTATGLAAGAALAGCTSAGAASARWNSPGSTGGSDGTSPGPSASAADITMTPADDSQNVSPADGVTVTAATGTLQSVTLTAAGKPVAGELSSDQKTWRSTGRLAFGASYTMTATTSSGGASATKTCTFTTVKPARQVGVTLAANAMASLNDGGTYGVGQPILVSFSRAPADQDAAVKAINLTVEPEVEVRWRWVNSSTVHGRPQTYWAPGTKITVNANAYGVNLGNGAYGKNNASATITIGSSHIAIADAASHYMQVYVDGKVVKNMPISCGKGGYTHGSKGQLIDFWTRSGVHVVLTKEPTHEMTSASYGITNKADPNYYDEIINLCCRISYSGEFTHSAPWSVYAQGHSNVSHGCINLSPANAQWIYNNFRLGDVVVVKNTPKQLPLDDGLGDWNVPWAQW